MKSFLEGRPTIDRKTTSLAVPASRTSQFPDLHRSPMESAARMFAVEPMEPEIEAEPEPAPSEHRDKKIETVQADGVIQKIVITCGCGEVIEVHCGY